MEQANIDGVQLEYELSGTGEPIVFIHGAFIADSFRPLLAEPALAAPYQLITYHRRGYGRSRTVDKHPISAELQAADCADLLHYLGVERVHVVGHSFGGCVALQLALDAPEEVGSLVLLEPAIFVGPSAPAYRESLLRSTERYRAEGAGWLWRSSFGHAGQATVARRSSRSFQEGSSGLCKTLQLLSKWTSA